MRAAIFIYTRNKLRHQNIRISQKHFEICKHFHAIIIDQRGTRGQPHEDMCEWELGNKNTLEEIQQKLNRLLKTNESELIN